MWSCPTISFALWERFLREDAIYAPSSVLNQKHTIFLKSKTDAITFKFLEIPIIFIIFLLRGNKWSVGALRLIVINWPKNYCLNNLFQSSPRHSGVRFKCAQKLNARAGKSYTREGSASFEKQEKPVWRPKGRQLNKFRSVLFTIMKTNWWILLSCLPSGLQSCFQAIYRD